MTTSNEHNNAPAVPQGWKLVPVEPSPEMMEAMPSMPAIGAPGDMDLKNKGWSLKAIQNRHRWIAALAAAPTPEPAPAQGEPFGHFRAEPFGWTDCAEDDEGAIALYERPQVAGLTDEGRADMACAVAAICTGASSRTVAATAIEWTERALRAKGQS